jgi:serine/threonine-protein kinase
MKAAALRRLLRPYRLTPLTPIETRLLTLVCSGIELDSGERVFVKILNSGIAGVRRNFLREIDLLKALADWPGVPRLVVSATGPELVFHACESVDGKSFDALAQAPEGRDLAVIMHHTGLLACWVRDLHRLGIAHRDLSPNHVFVRRDGSLAVVDFGMAKSMLRLSPAERQLCEGYDLQAFGMILWEMICGRPLFPYRDPRLADVIQAEMVLIREAGLPLRVTTLLMACLSARSELLPEGIAANARFKTAEELAAALEPA